jgi:hypothetical protein
MHGPWAELYDDGVQEMMGMRPGSQKELVIGSDDEDRFEAYCGLVSSYETHEDNYARAYSES